MARREYDVEVLHKVLVSYHVTVTDNPLEGYDMEDGYLGTGKVEDFSGDEISASGWMNYDTWLSNAEVLRIRECK